MAAAPVERHLFTIREGQTETTYVLDASAYSIGRDPNCAIVLNSKSISRKHAILLRTPSPQGKGYRYRIIDGDAQGRPSANGLQVNHQSCKEKQLEHKDYVVFGGQDEVQAQYRIEVTNNTLGSDQRVAQYRSLKAKDTDSLPTLSGEDIVFESGKITHIQTLPGGDTLISVELADQKVVQVPVDTPQIVANLRIGDRVNITAFNEGYLFLRKLEEGAEDGATRVTPPPLPSLANAYAATKMTHPAHKPSVVEPPLAPTLQGNHAISPDLKAQIETQAKLYRRCYETVIREMGDLQLNEDHYITIASHIMKSLIVPQESTGDTQIQQR